MNTNELNALLQQEIEAILVDAPEPEYKDFTIPAGKKPYVILVVGVNGVGKTTTIGKLANNYKKAGNQVVLGAADTFRAAATEQLTIWSERVGVPIVKQTMGADPSAVAFDTVTSAVSKNADVVIIDTAGRLHNKLHLMDELGKIVRVIQKQSTVDEILLVIDATTGQNGLNQANVFIEAVGVTGFIVTKIDGSAKGGVAIAIEKSSGLPIKFIGTGEQIEDFGPFTQEAYIAGLFD